VALKENPLLVLDPDGTRPLPFDSVLPEHVGAAVDTLIAEARVALDALGADTSAPTYATTLDALEAVTARLERATALVEHLEGVATTPALRDAWAEAQPRVSELFSSIPLHAGVYRRVRAFAETDEAKNLAPAPRRFLDKTLAELRRNGAELDDAGKARLAEIDVELSKITLRFGQNVLDATNRFELLVEDEARLAGLPDSALAAARASAESKGKKGFRLTLQGPILIPVLSYCDDDGIREALYRAFNSRATEAELDNRPLMKRILELRGEKAKLLGFASFADLVLDDRMAKTGGAARAFITTLRERTQPFFDRERHELEVFRRDALGPSAGPMRAWDVGYWSEKLRRARYDFDEEALRPYFSADRVVEGIFEIARRLYGVTIKPTTASVWSPAVKPFEITERDGSQGALFYVDLYPREDKRDGAWMHGLVTTAYGGGRRNVQALVGNLSSPIDGKPALLSHREVETLFHEFGHLLHHASSRVPVRSLSGTNVAWDFVELPSQIFENWSWEREALDIFARHVDTGAAVPEELLSRMRAAKTFRAATFMMRQLGFAEADLALHMDWNGEDVVDFARPIFGAHSAAELPGDYAMIASFSHLFSSPVGYAAGYYSYKWAEVLEADAFSRFAREGLFNPEVGAAFRDKILARGDSEDPMALFKAFMGREPRMDALFERDGLVSRAAQ
jgi:oligopeptidase A